MPISLTYVSEALFAAMVNERRTPFLSLAGLAEQTDPLFVETVHELASCEVPLAPFNGRLFDGASRVDAIVRLRPGVATAFELKLGTTRLSRTRIDEEWLTPCRPSHLGRRWKGNMMAILDRNFEELVDGDLVVQLNDERLVLTREWFVVARRQTLAMWKTAPPGFTEHVRFLAFEDIVAAFGGKEAFNALVRRMLDIDFYDEWVAPATSTGDER